MFRPLLMLSAALLALPASAHLMVARHGTLNLTDEGAWLVLSVPVSAFPALDTDGDGRASPTELRAAGSGLQDRVRDRVVLADDQGPRPLEGLVIHGADHDDATSAHLLVTGRFAPAPSRGPLTLTFDLFGEEQQAQAIRVREGDIARTITFTPEASRQPATAFDTPEMLDVPLAASTSTPMGWMALLAIGVVGLLTGADLRRRAGAKG